ncbi:Protein ALP1-like [Anabarilius grahami]|uniref:Putative nuclease HARBI1 n=1 Tax=Anabarilius grahami TaxID=495550 RepID=A0A3N0YXM4_ANAGA|nr:Protein ALP1-like [Anabarilius grahami]
MSLAGALWFAIQDDLLVNGLCNNTIPSSISSTKQDKQSSISEPITASETRTVLDGLDDRFLSRCLHLTRQCLRFIVDFIQARLKKDVFAPGHSPTSAEANILAALAFLAHGSLPSKITERLGVDQRAAGEAVNSIIKLLSDLSPDFITFPNSYNDRMGAAQAFKNLSGIPHVVGVLGYLHVKVSPPAGEEHMYMNTLGYHSVMMQVIFDVDGNLLSLEQCCPGGTPEQTVWENSDIGRQFSIFQHGHTWVVGSRSLLGCGHVLTPVEAFRIKSNAALQFNKAHAQLHGRAQQVFGSLKSRFQCLRDIGPIQSPELVACTIKACCVLHNICKKFSVPLPLDFSTEPLHPPSEVVNILAEQPFDYMEDTKEEMIEMFFNTAEDGNE